MKLLYTGITLFVLTASKAQNFDNALYFDAPGQYLRVDYNFPTTYIYNELWFRADSLTGHSMISCSAYGAGTPENRDNHYSISVGGDSLLRFRVRATTPTTFWMNLTGTTKIHPGSWHHVYIAWSNNDKHEIWLDGQLDASDNGHVYGNLGSINWSPPLLTVGTTFEDGNDSINFRGAIDEVRIWDSYRDSTWINDHMHDTLPESVYTDPNSDLAGYWRMDVMDDLGINNDGADDIRDHSTHARHGDTWGGITLTPAYDPTSIEEVSSRIGASVWPNPFEEQLTLLLDFKTAKRVSIEMFDLLGQQVYTQDLGTVVGNRRIELDEQNGSPSGLYLLKVCAEGNCEVLRIIKQ